MHHAFLNFKAVMLAYFARKPTILTIKKPFMNTEYIRNSGLCLAFEKK